MIRIKQFVLLILISFWIVTGFSQQTAVYSEAHKSFKDGLEHFDQGLYGMAQLAFKESMDDLGLAHEPELKFLRTQAELYYAKSAVRLDLPEAERLVLDFVQRHAPDPIATEANIEIANYYYNTRKFDKAIQFYTLVDIQGLPSEQQAEIRFKHGYSLFVRKEFSAARAEFASAKDEQTKFYYPINYYYGMCQYFEEDYAAATMSFEKVSNSEMYKTYVPYYITQIYFSGGQYDDVISYAEPKLDDRRLHNVNDIHHLIGQAYYEQGNYAAALPHLNEYESSAGKMREADFYQLAFSQYKLGMCDEAVKNFKQLKKSATALGQNANYYMADCFLKNQDITSARNALLTVMKLDFDLQMQEEALFNYGKLSAQTGYDFDAIKALRSISPSSQYFLDAQNVLREVFIYTRDYASAITMLEEIEDKSPTLKEAYQHVCLYRGIQLLNDNKRQEALKYLDKSMSMPVDQSAKTQALFWKAEILHYGRKFDESIDLYNQYFTIAKTVSKLPVETSVPVANYNQGYNYLKLKSFATAQLYFENAIRGINEQAYYSNSYFKNKVYPDALLRAGDCLFKRNKYADALNFYDESITLKKYGYVYAKYQKAMIQGLTSKPFEKIVLLEELTTIHPKSQFTDDAMYQLSMTYQEMGNREKAIPVLRRLVNDFPTSNLVNRAYLSLGLISYNNGDLSSAIEYYEAVFDNNPSPAEAQESLTALEEIYVQDLSDPDSYFDFLETRPGYQVSEFKKDSINFISAEIQYENGNYEKAIKAYTDYLSKFPKGVNRLMAYYHRGESHSLLKAYTSAQRDYGKIIEMGQSAILENALTKAALIAYNHEEDFGKAHEYYTQLEALSINEEIRFEAQLGALRSGYRIGRFETVQSMAGKVIDNPRSTQEQRAIAHYFRGKMAYDQKQYDQALQDFNQVTRISDNAQTAESRYLIARIYYLRKQLDLAEKLCHNANKENSNYPDWVAHTLILLSDIYVGKSDLFNARAALEAVIENFQGDSAIVGEAQQKLQVIRALEEKQSRIKKDSSKILELQYNEN